MSQTGMEHASSESTRSVADAALLAGARAGSIDQIDRALADGANINVLDDDGQSVLFLAAAQREHGHVVEHLITAGADIDAVGSSGRTILHHFVHWNDARLVQFAIDRECFLDIDSKVDGTALMVACWKGLPALANILIAAGADVNAKTPTGLTPLHMAKTAEIVDILVDAGARFDAINNGALAPLGYVAVRGNDEVGVRLVERGAPVNKLRVGLGPLPLAVRSWKPCLGLVERLCQAGANLNEQNDEGLTPAQMASYDRRTDALRILIQHGVDPLTMHPDGSTFLHHAAIINDGRTAAMLLDLGLDPLHARADGATFASLAQTKPDAKAVYDAWCARNAVRAVTQNTKATTGPRGDQ